MKTVFAVTLLALVASAVAEPPSSEYGAAAYTPQVHREVYVFSAPDEPEEKESRTIRVPGGDKNTNIIFVRTPSSSSSHNTEVILPEQDTHKNLVYVLLRKATSSADVKITRPAPRPQAKPEVHFIRYGSEGGYVGGAKAGGVHGGASPISGYVRGGVEAGSAAAAAVLSGGAGGYE